MSKIAIITDTDTSLPNDLAAANGIRQVSQNIHFGQEVFLSNVDLDDKKLFERIDREGKLPKTAAPAPGKFAEAFQAAFASGAEQIICLCVSSTVSATYNVAVMARELMPDRDISVIDTQSLSMGQGFMALVAAEAVQAGATKDEAVAQALDLRGRTFVFGALSTLKYIAMSGRVGHLAAGLATLLDVKPILAMKNGKLDMLEKIRTRRKAWERVVELTVQTTQGKSIERAAMLHVCALDQAQQLEGLFRERLALPEKLIYAELTPGLSVHTGSGLVGISFVVRK